MGRTSKLRTLFRPVGLREMERILESGSTRFPPRLPEQPIFYPVLTRAYAEQIAQRWNATSAPRFAGYVTEFHVDSRYVSRFEAHVVGSSLHRELWVPAEQLEAFNDHLVGGISLVGAYYGDAYTGPTPRPDMLQGSTARDQLPQLERILAYNRVDFILETRGQRDLVLLNFAFWIRTDLSGEGMPLPGKIAVLRAVRDVWTEAFPGIGLVGSDELDALSTGATDE